MQLYCIVLYTYNYNQSKYQPNQNIYTQLYIRYKNNIVNYF